MRKCTKHMLTLGHTTRKHQDWFDENDAEMLSLLEERRRTHDGNSSKGFFAAIKQVYGPQKTAVAPIRDTEGSQMLTEKPAIVSRWREYFSDLLNCPATA